MHKTLTVAFFGTLALSGCLNQAGNTDVACHALSTATPATNPNWSGTVFTIVMENQSQGDIFGSGDAPFINSLAKQNAVARGYRDANIHPSEPNYIWMVSGENFGILDDNDPGPAVHITSSSHLADQIEAAGLTWKTYQESMGKPCTLSSHGNYAAKHNPFIFFDDINGFDGKKLNVTQRCTDHVVDYSQFEGDLQSGNLPKYVFITPNLQSDMHDSDVKTGDNWLAREVPKILASDAFNKGGVLFLLWDEGGGYPNADDPPMIAISPNAKPGYVSQVAYDESSFLKTVETILGVDQVPCSKNPQMVKTMDDLFTVPLSSAPAAAPASPAPAAPAPTTPTI